MKVKLFVLFVLNVCFASSNYYSFGSEILDVLDGMDVAEHVENENTLDDEVKQEQNFSDIFIDDSEQQERKISEELLAKDIVLKPQEVVVPKPVSDHQKDVVIRTAEKKPNQYGSMTMEEVLKEMNEYNGRIESSTVEFDTASVVDNGSSSGVSGSELNSLANKYRNGDGVPKDKNKAMELYEQAAALGDVGAQSNLGRIYYFGTMGVRKDYNRAFSLLSSAASQGNRDSQSLLGDMYARGQGTRKDKRRAAQLYQQAASQGEREALTKIKRYKKYL